METPRPTAHHARLTVLAGKWEGDETLHPVQPWRPAASSARGRFTIRMDLEGFFLLSDYMEHQGGVQTYAGHGVYGWDAKRERYTMQWFDSMGGSYDAPARGTFEGNVLEFRLDGPGLHARYVYEILGADEFTFRILTSPDSVAWTPFMEGRYRRVS